MNVIKKKTIIYYTQEYPLAKTALLVWLKEFSGKAFKNFNELKETYSNASIVANQRVIFNIKGNEFRLITGVNFITQSAYIIWFGTHQEYNKIDAASIKHFDF